MSEKPKTPSPLEDDKKKETKKEEQLSDEDLKKKEDLELMVTRVGDSDPKIVRNALELLKTEIRTSTSSMTAVPKPLKFLRPHRNTLVEHHAKMSAGENKELLADILSVLSMTVENTTRETLRYKLMGSKEAVSDWGHEYLRHLSGEIAEEVEDEESAVMDKVMALVDEIVPYNIKHHAEPEAVDLLLEVDRLPSILTHVDETNFERISLYLVSCAQFTSSPETIYRTTVDIYMKVNQYARALQVVFMLKEAAEQKQLIQIIWSKASSQDMKRQLAFMLARQHMFGAIELTDDEKASDEHLEKILYNSMLSKYFQALQNDLHITDPKEPEDIYKSHLIEGRGTTNKGDSAQLNMASSFVSAFVNAGSGKDKLMTTDPQGWLGRNRTHGTLAAVASIGLIHKWDMETGSQELDKYISKETEHIKAGGILGMGIVAAGIKDEYDAVFSSVSDHLTHSSSIVKQCTALSLAISHTGSARSEISELLVKMFEDHSLSIEVLGHVSLSLGLLCAGSADTEIASTILDVFERMEDQLKGNVHHKLLAIGLGLLYLGKPTDTEAIINIVSTLGPAGVYAANVVEVMSMCNSGSTEDVQKLLHKCNEHLEKDDDFQGVAVLGIAMVAMAEDIGAQMCVRTLDHLLRYGELSVRRAVPLALALLSIGNPTNVTIVDTLSKLSHDNDSTVVTNAIFSLGLIGVGTNNSRIAQLLRQLVSYHYKDNAALYAIRLAQALLHMGKGTLSIRPDHTNGTVTNIPALASLLAVLFAALDFPDTLGGNTPHLLFILSSAMYPRLLMTLDENLDPKPILVRVGQAMDVVGQAGKPKTITGFQTHTTPVLLTGNERAELASDQWLTCSPDLEGFVIVKPNPDAKPEKSILAPKKK